MKKLVWMMAIALCCSSAEAQYKKASFLTRSGRTYDLGLAIRPMSDGVGTTLGFHYSYGKDKGKRMFHWFDLEVLLPTKYAYTSYELNNTAQPVAVSGKSKLGLIYRYNLAGYLTDITKTDIKFKPFATLGLNMMIFGGTDNDPSFLPEFSNPRKIPLSSQFSVGANAGLGCIYNLNPKVGLKLAAGYNFQTQMDLDNFEDSGYEIYQLYQSHPYVTLGVRFTMADN